MKDFGFHSPYTTNPAHNTKKSKSAEEREKKYAPDQDQRDPNLNLESLVLLLLFDLQQQSAIDVREDTTKGDRGANERVEFFVSANGELQVAGSDTLDFQILCGVLEQLALRT